MNDATIIKRLRLTFVVVFVSLTFVVIGYNTCCAEAADKEDAKMNYTALIVLNDSGIVTKATGIVISHSKVLTCFHVLDPGTKVAAPNGKEAEDGEVNVTVATVVACDPYHDWCILDFNQSIFDPGRLRFAKTILVGEPVVAVTNALGADSMSLISHVAKVDEYHIWFYPAFPKGSSGGALYMRDQKDRPVFIGMVQGELGIEGTDNIGYALRARILKPVIQEHTRPPRPNVVPFDVERGNEEN